jgi:hypothetical protein
MTFPVSAADQRILAREDDYLTILFTYLPQSRVPDARTTTNQQPQKAETS